MSCVQAIRGSKQRAEHGFKPIRIRGTDLVACVVASAGLVFDCVSIKYSDPDVFVVAPTTISVEQ